MSGWIYDIYGRKILVQVGLYGITFWGILSAFSNNIWTFVTIRTIVGICMGLMGGGFCK